MDVSNILSTLAAMGLDTLREHIILAKIANRQYEGPMRSATKHSTVNVVVPSAVNVVAVTAGATPPATASTTPTSVAVSLDEHYESPFYLNDVDMAKVNMGILPMQAAEAVKSLANKIEATLFARLKKAYGIAGTPGTTPFATDLSAYTEARKIANKQLMPLTDRYVVLNPDAEEKAINLRAFQDASFSGSNEVIVNGQIGRKLGAVWAMSQNVPNFDSDGPTGWLVNSAAVAVGNTTVAVDSGTNNPKEGDIFTVAGDSQTYVVESFSSNTITFAPGAKVAWADNSALTFKADHALNALIHRDAIAFAMAPLVDTNIAPGLAYMQPVVDAESGLALRLEVTREHKRWRWSFDALWGSAVPRRELMVRIAG